MVARVRRRRCRRCSPGTSTFHRRRSCCSTSTPKSSSPTSHDRRRSVESSATISSNLPRSKTRCGRRHRRGNPTGDPHVYQNTGSLRRATQVCHTAVHEALDAGDTLLTARHILAADNASSTMAVPSDNEDRMSVDQAAELLGFSHSLIRYMLADGRIPDDCIISRNPYRFSGTRLLEWLRANPVHDR